MQESRKTHFSNDHWLSKNHPQRRSFDYVKESFGRDEVLTIGFEFKKPVLEKDVFLQLSKLSEKIKTLPFVTRVRSLANSRDIFNFDKGAVEVIDYRRAFEKYPKKATEIQKKIKKSSYSGWLFNKKKIALIVSFNFEQKETFKKRSDTLREIHKILKTAPMGFSNYRLYGVTQLRHQTDLEVKNNLIYLSFSLLAFIFLSSLVFFRKLRLTFFMLFPSVLCVSLSLFIFNIFGYPLSVIGVILPILIVVISISDSVHIVDRFTELMRRKMPSSKAAWETFHQMKAPCFLTSLTTSIGFGSFYWSEILTLKNFGVVAFWTCLGAYIITMTFWLLAFLSFDFLSSEKPKLKFYDNFLSRIKLWVHYKSLFISIIGGCVLLTSALLLFFSRIETNFLDVFFKKNSPVYQSFLWGDKNMGGSSSLNLLIEGEKGVHKKIENLSQSKDLVAELKSQKEVLKVHSYLDAVHMTHAVLASDKQSFPQDQKQLSQELFFLRLSEGEDRDGVLASHMNLDYSKMLIDMQTKTMSSQKIATLVKEVQELKKKYFSSLKWTLTGFNSLFYTLSRLNLETQIRSMLFLSFIMLMALILLFDVFIGIAAFAANVLPVVSTLGLMVLLGEPFDFATALITAIGFGICVDDTFHFLYYFKISKKNTQNVLLSLKDSVSMLGFPLAYTSLLFGGGFLIFIFSELRILIKFGLFSGVLMILAYFSNMVLLPSLIAQVDKWRNVKKNKLKGL